MPIEPPADDGDISIILLESLQESNFLHPINGLYPQGPACFSPHASNKARDEWNTQLNSDRYRTVLNNIRTYYAKEFREGDKAYQVVPIIDDVLGSEVEITNPDSLEKRLADAEQDIAEGFALVDKMEAENNRLRAEVVVLRTDNLRMNTRINSVKMTWVLTDNRLYEFMNLQSDPTNEEMVILAKMAMGYLNVVYPIHGESRNIDKVFKSYRNAFDEPSAIEPFGDLGKE